MKLRTLALATLLLCLVGCKKRPLYVHAEPTITDDVLRIHVSTLDESTVSILGTTDDTDYSGAADFSISAAQIPPGQHSIRVEVTSKGSKPRHGFAWVDFVRPSIVPSLKLGTVNAYDIGDLPSCAGAFCAGPHALKFDNEGGIEAAVDAPPGCIVEVAGESLLVPVRLPKFSKDNSYAYAPPDSNKPSLTINLRDKILDAKLPDALDATKTSPLTLPAKVTCDGQSVQDSIVLSGASYAPAISHLFEGAKTGPVTFGPNDKAPASPKTALLATGYPVYVGKPGLVRDVDLVVFREYKPRSGGSCGPYQNYDGQNFYATLSLNDENMKVFDRRTGKLVKEQTLQAWGSCPEYVTGTSYGGGTPSASVSGDVDSSRETDFVKTLVK